MITNLKQLVENIPEEFKDLTTKRANVRFEGETSTIELKKDEGYEAIYTYSDENGIFVRITTPKTSNWNAMIRQLGTMMSKSHVILHDFVS